MLKSRDQFPPGGFLFLQPQTGWEAPPGQSFMVVVNALIAHRKSNPGLAKQHNWALDYDTVANEVDAYNDARCRASGWLSYVSGDQTAPFHMPPLSPRPVAAAVGGVKRIAVGVKTLLDWLGSGARPVDQKLADGRAAICAGCPKNGKGDWTRFFTVPASHEIRLQLEIKNDIKLATPDDEKLGVCEVCLCPLKLKVWCPLSHVLKEMSAETRAGLVPQCWILNEKAER